MVKNAKASDAIKHYAKFGRDPPARPLVECTAFHVSLQSVCLPYSKTLSASSCPLPSSSSSNSPRRTHAHRRRDHDIVRHRQHPPPAHPDACHDDRSSLHTRLDPAAFLQRCYTPELSLLRQHAPLRAHYFPIPLRPHVRCIGTVATRLEACHRSSTVPVTSRPPTPSTLISAGGTQLHAGRIQYGSHCKTIFAKLLRANNKKQVLNKRKPVNLITTPPNVPDSTEVRFWISYEFAATATDARMLPGLCHERHE